jgi:hypothetical protein
MKLLIRLALLPNYNKKDPESPVYKHNQMSARAALLVDNAQYLV